MYWKVALKSVCWKESGMHQKCMCVCLCVYICVCVCVHIYTHIYTYIYTIYVCVYIYIYIHICVCVCTSMCVSLYAFLCVCVCVCFIQQNPMTQEQPQRRQRLDLMKFGLDFWHTEGGGSGQLKLFSGVITIKDSGL